MDQTLINWLLSGFGGLIGFLLHMIWQAVKDLQKADTELANKVGEIEVLVAGHYMLKADFTANITAIRSDLTSNMTAVFNKLERIEDKLDRKVDK